jgi:hypothetical protein
MVGGDEVFLKFFVGMPYVVIRAKIPAKIK